MLKINEGAISIRGRKIDLLAEFAQLVNHLRVKEIFSDEDIKMCIEVASMTEEEISAKVEEMEKDVMSKFLSNFKEFLDDLEKDVKKSE